MTELDLQRKRNQDRSPGSSSSSSVNSRCDLRQTASTFCQMGVLGQSVPQVPSSAVKMGLGGNQRTETQSPRILGGSGRDPGDFGSTQLLPLGG